MIYPAHQEALIEGKAYRVLRANVSESLARFDLSMPEWTLLGQLYESGEMRLMELASLLAVEAPLVTTLVKELDQKGLLAIKNHPQDNRAKLIDLTSKGKKLLPKISQTVHKNLESLTAGVKAADIAAYFRVLEKIILNSNQ